MDYKFKQPEKVVFTEKGHTYHKGDQAYISVTTLLGLYAEPFDSEYWATYKAVKDILEEAGIWTHFKRNAGGWQKVVDKYNEVPSTVYGFAIAKRKQQYLDDWKYEGEYGAELGHKAHKELEGAALHAQKVEIEPGVIGNVSSSDILDMQGFNQADNAIFTELLLWNDEFKLAGQADIVERRGKNVHVKDYKTCKVIKTDHFMERRLYHPLEEMYDTDYNKFTMQLSAYGWMLEQQGYHLTGLTMIHLDRITGKHIKDYELDYRPDLVRNMLEHYKQAA